MRYEREKPGISEQGGNQRASKVETRETENDSRGSSRAPDELWCLEFVDQDTVIVENRASPGGIDV